VAFGDGPRTGDIELHVFTSDFGRHGHGTDPAYDNVILHVVFFDDAAEDVALASGYRAPTVALGLTALDRPTRRREYREPCRDSVDRLGGPAVEGVLDRLGLMRFRQKTAAWRRRLRGGLAPEQALWEGLLEALGYGGEREALAELAAIVPWEAVRPVAVESVDGTERLLGRGWTEIRPNILYRAALRPRNSSGRRIRGAAELASRFARSGGIGHVLVAPLETADSANGSVSALVVPGLVGRGRAVEIVGNVVLPLAAAACSVDGVLEGEERFERLFGTLPLPARYGSVRHLHEVTAGPLKVDMRRQQGMLYLLRQYCGQGGCGKCPLS
jgi:hypothetical protein